MHRVTDVEKTAKRLPHIFGYQHLPLLPLQQVLTRQIPKIRGLRSSIQTALNECHYPTKHGLTRDESGAIYLYTMEFGNHGIYQALNRALRSKNYRIFPEIYGEAYHKISRRIISEKIQ